MKKLILAILLTLTPLSADEINIQFQGNNPSGSVDYIVEIKRENDQESGFILLADFGENEKGVIEAEAGDEIRVYAKGKNGRRSEGYSNVVTIPPLPENPTNLKIVITIEISN